MGALARRTSTLSTWGTVIAGSVALGYSTAGGPPGVGCGIMRSSTARRIRNACSEGGDDAGGSPDNFIGFDGPFLGGMLSSLVVLALCVVAAAAAVVCKGFQKLLKQRTERSTIALSVVTLVSQAAASLSMPGLLIVGPHSLLSAPMLYNGVLVLASGGVDNGGVGGIALATVGLTAVVGPLIVAAYKLTFGFDAVARRVAHRTAQAAAPVVADRLRSWPLAQRVAYWLLQPPEDAWVSTPARQSFLGQYGALFDTCRRERHWYFLVETALGVAASLLLVLVQASQTADTACGYVGPVVCVVQLTALGAVALLRPFGATWEQCCMVALSVLGATSGVLGVVPGAEAAAEAVDLCQLVAATLFTVLTLGMVRHCGWGNPRWQETAAGPHKRDTSTPSAHRMATAADSLAAQGSLFSAPLASRAEPANDRLKSVIELICNACQLPAEKRLAPRRRVDVRARNAELVAQRERVVAMVRLARGSRSYDAPRVFTNVDQPLCSVRGNASDTK